MEKGRLLVETRIPESFEAAYAKRPAWDIGRPQPALVNLFERGLVRGRVLDVGCGTGEHTLALAARGEDALGIDLARSAIAQATTKAHQRGLARAAFVVADALDLGRLAREFDVVLDSGLFHVLSDDDRRRYAANLAHVLATTGSYVALVFSEKEPAHWGGPRRVSRDDLVSTFAESDGWHLESLEDTRFHTTMELHVRRGGACAWLARFSRRVSGISA